MNPPKIIGCKYGHLTVLRLAPNAKFGRTFICQCDCGRKAIREYNQLENDYTTCGKQCEYRMQIYKNSGLKKRLSEEEAKHKLKITNPTIKFLEPYIKSDVKILVECMKCKYKWRVKPNNLFNGSRCPNCSRSRQPTHYQYLLGKRRVFIQGYEDRVLNWLLNQPGIKSDDIEVCDESRVIIKYRFGGLRRNYFPDIIVAETDIYEVKSYYWFLKDFEKNRAKALACINQGYNFHMIIASGEGDIADLSEHDWLDWSIKKAYSRMNYFRKMPFRIMGIDPGTKNMSWSIIEAKEKGYYKIISHGMFKYPINDLTTNGSAIQADNFAYESNSLICKYNVSRIVAERFISRGIRGGVIEKVNYMLGMLDVGIKEPGMDGQFMLITPAQWKNQFNKHCSLENLYKDPQIKLNKITKHQIDATCIALYGMANWLKVPYFNFLLNRKNTFIKRIIGAKHIKKTK